MDTTLTDKQKVQIDNYLNNFILLSNKFFDDGNYKLHEYWKGQVFGICKVISVLHAENELSPEYYLNQLV